MSWLEHLPAMTIVVPLMAAAVCVLIRHANASRLWAIAVTWATFAMAIKLLLMALEKGPFSYQMGGYEAPFGIEYRVDVFSAVILCLVSGIASVVLPWGPTQASVNIVDSRKNLYYTAFLLCMTGLMGMTITGDLFNVFVFLEISSLSTYVLIGMGDDRRSLVAAFTYLVIGTIGGTFYLIGVGFLYAMTGTLNMADMATLLVDVNHTRTVQTALGFIVTGLSIKLALFPLHQWLPNAYTYAPSQVSAFIAATATKVSIYALIRVLFGVFGTAFVFDTLHFDRVLLVLALMGIFGGTLVAIYEDNIKRMLAYSSIAQVGYMILGVSMVNVPGLTGGIVHLINHALMKGGLFLVLGCVAWQVGGVHLKDFRGLGKLMPFTMAAYVVGGLSMLGVPLTVGFVSKWYLVLGAIENGMFLVTAMVLLSSLLSVLYIWKVVEVAYFEERPDDLPPVQEAPLSMLIPTWVLIGSTLVFGVYTPWTAGMASMAAKSLLGAS